MLTMHNDIGQRVPSVNPDATMHPRCLAYHQTYPWLTQPQANVAAQFEEEHGDAATEWFIVALSWQFTTTQAREVTQAYVKGGDVGAWREVFLVRNPGTRPWLLNYPFLTEAQALVALHYEQQIEDPAPALCYVSAVRHGFTQTKASQFAENALAVRVNANVALKVNKDSV